MYNKDLITLGKLLSWKDITLIIPSKSKDVLALPIYVGMWLKLRKL
jgi:hypothetical protein